MPGLGLEKIYAALLETAGAGHEASVEYFSIARFEPLENGGIFLECIATAR